jgi:single-strand DNA-binding protein
VIDIASLSKVILVGNLGSDPEMRYTPNGKAVTSFNVATNRRYTTSGGESKEETDWFRVSVWGKQAEQCNQFLSKGKQVYVEGRLHARSWEGQDGQMRTSLEVNAERVLFLGRRDSVSLPGGEEIEPEDLPFEVLQGEHDD